VFHIFNPAGIALTAFFALSKYLYAFVSAERFLDPTSSN
jgi:hypothetical protein